MNVIRIHEKTHVLRFDREEEVLSLLKRYCQENNINAGYFSAVGAAKNIELGWYSLDKKEFDTKNYPELMEISSLTGNVSVTNKDITIHAHGVFSTPKTTAAAHILRMTVGLTCEVILHALPEELNRSYDENTGLNLLT